MNRFFYFICILFFLPACSGKPETTEESAVQEENNLVRLTEKQIQLADLQTGEATTRKMHLSLQVTGIIDVHPGNDISISAPLGGYLKKTELIPGKKVAKGSILAVLEDQQYIQIQQDYLTAKNKLQFLEADYKRQKSLNETKASSDKSFQQVQSEYSNQRVLLRSLEEQLRLIGLAPEKLTESNLSRSVAIHSPISGYVTKVNVNIGKYVTPSDVLFELINPEDVCVNLTVFENDVPGIAIGQTVKLHTNNKPGTTYEAVVELVSPSIDPDRSTQVHAKLSKKNPDLIPGTYVQAEIELNDAPVTCVPSEALVKWESKEYVFMLEQAGVYRMIPVQTGISNEGFTQIKSGLPSGKIVTKNAYTLLMKLKNSGE